MDSFEGDFRPLKPQQSLGGVVKKEGKMNLLERTAKERDKRADARRRTQSATRIQSFYRSARVKAHEKQKTRTLFDVTKAQIEKDTIPITTNNVSCLVRALLFFFNSSEDHDRLAWLCQILIKNKDIYLGNFPKDGQAAFHQLKNLLQLCARYLCDLSNSTKPIALPMRMLEILTAHDSYQSLALADTAVQQLLRRIYSHLIVKDYYKHLNTLLHAKVPTIFERTARPPTPAAASIYELIMRPVQAVFGCNDATYKNLVLQSLCKEFLCSAYTEQVSEFLLPAMVHGSVPFPFPEMISALCDEFTTGDSTDSATWTSPWLLYAVLLFSQQYIERLTSDQINQYWIVLQKLVPTLSDLGQRSIEDGESDEEDMDTGESSQFDLRGECVRLLELPKHTRHLVLISGRDGHPEIFVSVCTICHVLMSELKRSVHKERLLYTLAFNPQFVRRLWKACTTVSTTNVTGSRRSLLQMLSSGLPMLDADSDRIIPLLSVFCSLFSHSVMSLHDTEFYSTEGSDSPSTMPLSLSELVPMTLSLRDACLGIIELMYPDTKHHLGDYSEALKSMTVVKQSGGKVDKEAETRKRKWAHLFKVMVQLIRQLYSRDTRQPFCPRNHWLAGQVKIHADKQAQIFKPQKFGRRPFGETLRVGEGEEEGPPLSTHELRSLTVLTELPFCVSFAERVKIFQRLVNQDKANNHNDIHSFIGGQAIRISVRRDYLYEDAFDKLSPDNEPNLKLRMQVQLRNVAGLDEAGIDGGGLFREFLSELLKTAFDPNRGFFTTTPDKLIYPNTDSQILVEGDFRQHYYFIGRMIGKAIYENMLVELPFAGFFLSKLLSRHGGDVDILHLASLDPDLYKNLLFLKTFTGEEINQLNLDFTVTSSELDMKMTEELKPGGRDVQVTDSNKIEYIHLMADYRLNKQIREHTKAFRSGLADVIDIEWLRMFDYNELQVLISGAEVTINLDDLKQHTNYSGGYTADHVVIKTFWKVLESFNDQERRQLLKFVTSCSRPPLLGFKELYPPLCIHYGGNEPDRLPSASTCMNLLKLPEFSNEKLLRNKLLYAIQSGAGFELS